MQITHEHEEIQRTLKRFIDEEINPHVDEWEAAEEFPAHQVFKRLGELGLLGLTKPRSTAAWRSTTRTRWRWPRRSATSHCGGVPMAIGVQTDMCTPALARFGSEALCREFLAPAIAGDAVGCIGVSEPGAGSDVASIKTTAKKDGDDYVINGAKMWITNSLQADWMCLLANTSEGAAHKNKSLIMVPMNTPGRHQGEEDPQDRHDVERHRPDPLRRRARAADQPHRRGRHGLHLPDDAVPGRAPVGRGERDPGPARTASSMTADYARERQIFGKSVLDHQVVHYKLAELKTEVESLRGLVYMATEKYVAGDDVTEWASMAKLKSCRLAALVPDACMQYWGGMGYTWDNPVSRLYRDGRLGSIAGGADEVMLGIIAKYMHTLPSRR